MIPQPRSHRGFTLVEIMLVFVIMAGVMGAVLVSLLTSRTSYVSAEAYVEVQQVARQAFDTMVKELHEAGQVNNNVGIPEPGVQRLDFQIVRDYDAAACGGVCWGTDEAALPAGWIHYDLDTTDPDHARFMRCVTANRDDPMPAGYAGCQVLSNWVNPDLANSSFLYDHGDRIITIRLQTSITSQQLPGGSMGTTPVPLITQVRLRNAS